METKNFGLKVSERLDRMGKDQAELATAIDSSPQYVSDMIRLNRIPGGKRLVEIAIYLETTARYLMDDAIGIGDVPGLPPEEERLLRNARIVGIDEAERRILVAPARAKVPAVDRDWGGDRETPKTPPSFGKPKSG